MTIRWKTLPLRVNTAILAPYFTPGEPAVIVKLVGVGSTTPFEMRGGGTPGRSFILEWNSRLDGHVVRIPLSLWMANDARMAHELMDHRRMSHAMVVTFEMPVAAVTAPAACDLNSISVFEPAKTGAAESNVDASILVVRGQVPSPAAPTLAEAKPREQSPAPPPAVTTATATATATAAADVTAPTNETVTPGDAGVPMIGGRPVHEAAHERLLKPQRVKALAALLKVSEATLREAVNANGARIEIAGPWVRRRVLS